MTNNSLENPNERAGAIIKAVFKERFFGHTDRDIAGFAEELLGRLQKSGIEIKSVQVPTPAVSAEETLSANPMVQKTKEVIGSAFVQHCREGRGLDRSEFFESQLQKALKTAGLPPASVKPIFFDSNRGPASRYFFDNTSQVRARVNYWQVICACGRFAVPEPRSSSQFGDPDLNFKFSGTKVTPSTISRFVPVELKTPEKFQEPGKWEADYTGGAIG